MKVICIKDVPIICPCDFCKNFKGPKVGDIDKVISVDPHTYTQETMYTLESYGEEIWFRSVYFAEISDQENKQLTEEQAEEIRKRQLVSVSKKIF